MNYQTELEKIIDGLDGKRPKLLLHSCCGPCSTYCLEYLTKYFDVTVFYYNPNIYPESEYNLRLEEQKKVIKTMRFSSPVALIVGKYETDKYKEFVKGLEYEREGGARCEKCFELRLEETAICAVACEYDYFCTTLTVSPHKNAEVINRIGQEMAEKHGVKFLPADFKKKGGYLRSIQLSKEYDIYRQYYCGCSFAMARGE